ncbi:hypothetical protein AB6A40_007295 [Gnathostoma spinigerum]|uniref:Uncharacterized protein n=1 Tax=Gnathostoma spinigerum TaxID=75299 RepID=A0ABD6ELD6_9BILA
MIFMIVWVEEVRAALSKLWTIPENSQTTEHGRQFSTLQTTVTTPTPNQGQPVSF